MKESDNEVAAAFTFTELTPTAFLDRSMIVFADQEAVIDGEVHLTYAEFGERCLRLAGGLLAAGVGVGDRVAALCSNSHVLLELHHGVPYRGAVLVPLNVRLSLDDLAFALRHSGSTMLVATREHAPLARKLAEQTGIVVFIEGEGGEQDYGRLLGEPTDAARAEIGEREPLAISYTSGTTGRPKGVVYHRRGGYLQALAMLVHVGLNSSARYLWTLPQFHCDGWCFTWAVTAAGGVHVCLRSFDADEAWALVAGERVTHLSAAPTVLNMLVAAESAPSEAIQPAVQVSTGGAPPSQMLLERLASYGLEVTHLYGLTETFGPLVLNEWRTEWDGLSAADRARLKARQGVGNVVSDPIRVLDSAGLDVPRDGRTVGEIVCRGNNVMLGYLDDPAETAAVTTPDGWFRTGDLAVMHPDRYVEIRDRAKDIIISGGENISSVEIEQVLQRHPAVFEAAVVAKRDEVWGEVPVAFVQLKADVQVSGDELIGFVRDHAARFKAPREVHFLADLPRTATGKIEKPRLRRQVSVPRICAESHGGGPAS
jgi:fatty-acyl-CoA synthase